jgi:thiol-disulfide isomerase/thioredoxin
MPQLLKTLGLFCSVVLLSSLLFSCYSESGGTNASGESTATPQEAASAQGSISGSFKNATGASVELRVMRNGQLESIAHTTADEDGQFLLSPSTPLAYDYYQVRVNQSSLVLITDSTESLLINGTLPANGYIVGVEITGSPGSALLSEYYDTAMPFQPRLAEAKKAGDHASFSKIRTEADRWSRTFIKMHKGDPSTLAALEHLVISLGAGTYEDVLLSTKERMGETTYHKMLQSQWDINFSSSAMTSQTGRSVNKPRVPVNAPPPANKKRGAKNAMYSVGDMAPEIAMPDPDGVMRKLSDLRGKVVLIDFWASWCGPCRRENPTVVRAYKEYKDKGFDVFSVSLDKKADRWKKAIEQDGLIWPNHVSDLKGWSNAASRAYGISSIPHTILVGADGRIIATHVRGRTLETRLAELID